MKRVEWSRVLRCSCALACISCADTLGLHDLVEGHDAGGGPAENATSSDGGEALAIEAGTPTGTDLGDAVPEASTSSPTSSDLTIVGLGDSAAPSETDTGPAAPVTDAMSVVDAAPLEPDGDAPMHKPDGAAAGCRCGAAPCTVHSNGVGQTFEDCVPNGTHDKTQALAACSAFTGTSMSCTIQSCESGGPGKSAPGQAACSTGASVCDCWTFAGAEVGLVQSAKSMKCNPCANGGVAWH